ncbi:hypothetical protein HK099_007833 [Clydaea vesicula]|uniref:OB domain-containing protein n=1 Tax=Clydaea vesicula TaxID=447962 RepID=A0AAD5Y424_9FUNG|nr:hypothetical protein HK099_007833 [Clydaea vesicula]
MIICSPNQFSTNYLFISQIKRLEKHEILKEYFYLNKKHLIKFVQVVGLIVEAEEKTNFILYNIDDGSCTIRIVQWLRQSEVTSRKFEYLKLGSLILDDPNQEFMHWLKAIDISQNDYCKNGSEFFLTEELEKEIIEVNENKKEEITNQFVDLNREDSNFSKVEFEKKVNSYLSANDVDPEQLKDLFEYYFKNGIIYQKEVDDEKELDEYSLITVTLKKDIFKLIELESGISFDQLLVKLKFQRKYFHLSKSTLRECLQCLINGSDIIEVNKNAYKVY